MEPGFNILDAIDRSALMKRGTLRAWMVANYQAFKDRLETRKPDWPTLAQVFSDAGLLDARGKPPTAEATRKTWYRVKSDLVAAPSRTTQPTQGATYVQPTRPGSFDFHASPKEGDEERLLGKRKDR